MYACVCCGDPCSHRHQHVISTTENNITPKVAATSSSSLTRQLSVRSFLSVLQLLRGRQRERDAGATSTPAQSVRSTIERYTVVRQEDGRRSRQRRASRSHGDNNIRGAHDMLTPMKEAFIPIHTSLHRCISIVRFAIATRISPPSLSSSSRKRRRQESSQSPGVRLPGTHASDPSRGQAGSFVFRPGKRQANEGVWATWQRKRFG